MKHYIWDGRDLAITQVFGVNRDDYIQFGLAGHNGIDIGAWTGTRIRAAEDGTVIEVSSDPLGYGFTVYLLGDSGRGWRHGHFSRLDVIQSQRVTRGDVLGLSGNSGNSSGPHLHLGMRPANPNNANGYGGYVDPMPVLNELQEEDVTDTERQEMQARIDDLDGQNTTREQQITDLRTELSHVLDEVVPALVTQLAEERAANTDSEPLNSTITELREKVQRAMEVLAA
jgi:hypothetical protein